MILAETKVVKCAVLPSEVNAQKHKAMKKSPTDKASPAWQEFETVIAKIQRQLAPQAEVRHNHRLRGKSGRLRQLDVTATQKIGLVPILVVFECKHYGRVVSIEKVEAFVQKLLDVGASSGVMISIHGFDEGAKAVAKQNSVMLLTCREAKETDWQRIVGTDAWLRYTTRFYEWESAGLQFKDRSVNIPEMSLDTIVYAQGALPDDSYIEIASIQKLLFEEIPQNLPPTEIGRFQACFFADCPLFVLVGDVWQEIEKIDIVMKATAMAWFLNLPIASGKVLEGVGHTEVEYVHAVSEGFDWQELVKRQSGKVLTSEEYRQLLDAPGMKLKLTASESRDLQQYMHIIITHEKLGAHA